MVTKGKVRAFYTVILDLGNSLLKGMIENMWNGKVSMSHAVRFLTEAQYKQFSARGASSAMRGKQGMIFVYKRKGQDPIYCMVGEMAEGGAFERRTGGAKYDPAYYPILMCALLLQLYPSGNDNLQIMNAFPPSDLRFVDTMQQALGGKHEITLPNGETIVYRVKAVRTYDEPVGGLCCFVLANDGIHYQTKTIAPNHRVLTIDIGGKISSLAMATLNNGVDYSQTFSFDLGIQDVMNRLSDLMLDNPEIAKHFSTHRGAIPHDEKLRSALKLGVYDASGYELSVLDEIADATLAIRQRIKESYDVRFGGLSRFDHIIITGGGGALLYEQLKEHVLEFNPKRVYLAHNVEQDAHYANMLGGGKILNSLLDGGS